MSKRLQRTGLIFILILAAAQLVRPDRTNPPTDPSRAIRAQAGMAAGMVDALDRSCGDCHTNGTVWPSYTQVAPVSWLMAYGVKEGRKAVNFSEWGDYPPDRQRQLLAESCRDVSTGKMPGAYARLRPETRLTAEEIQLICAAAGAASR
jgi:hypothetical protein